MGIITAYLKTRHKYDLDLANKKSVFIKKPALIMNIKRIQLTASINPTPFTIMYFKERGIIAYKITRHMTVLIKLLLLLFFGCIQTATADIAIIVHPSNTLSNISPVEIQKLYLGKNRFFSNGNNAIAVDQKEGGIRNSFYTNVIKKEGSALKAYWSKRIFSGKGSPPDKIGHDMAVKIWVSGHTTAIGFIASEKIDDTVKVIHTISE